MITSKMKLPIILTLIILPIVNGQSYYQPEQIHLSYPDIPTKMTATWSTFSDTNSSICEYGETRLLSHWAEGFSTLFVDGGPQRHSQFIHRVTMTDLIPGQKYWYHCGSDLGWSELYTFYALKNGTNWSPSLAIFGDLGNENAQSLPYLQEESQRGVYDMILHVGDFAYNMDTNNAQIGDEFMRQIQPIAAYAPYMVCVGNHEHAYNFSNYKNRFTMPNTMDNMMYTFDIGPVHFIAFSTEFYFYAGLKEVSRQYEWLEKELKEANNAENRALRPWIVTFGHRPMYCSNNDGDDCSKSTSVIRVGLPVVHWFGLEELFNRHGVDVALWAHEHSYERLWPVYNTTVMNGSYEFPYTNPKATVHITTGSAGCWSKHDGFEKSAPPWTAFRSIDYGYTRMRAHNSTHLYFEQVSVDKVGKVIDKMWLMKQKHGSFPELFPHDYATILEDM